MHIMNFLNRSCSLTHFGHLPFQIAPCCHNIVKSQTKKQGSAIVPLKLSLAKQCTGKLYALTTLTSWMQVRFNKSCPPAYMHRDLIMPNFDNYRKKCCNDVRKTTWGAEDGKVGITYVISYFGFLAGAYGAKACCIHYMSYMAPGPAVLAMASIEVELSGVEEGKCGSFKWRGKPLFVKRRNQKEIDIEDETPLSTLRDPETSAQRTKKPEWVVVVGVCTHLGCIPIANTGDFVGGWYCPCHGSHFDNLGRARKGPAPTNLVVPPYVFLGDTLILVG